MQIFLICILIKQQKHMAINNYLITHFTKQTLNLNYLLLTLNVMVQLLNYPKQKSPFFFLIFNSRSMVATLCFGSLSTSLFPWVPEVFFCSEAAILTLEILSDQMHTLPPNSADHTIFLFFTNFRRSKSFCTLPFALQSNVFAQN